MPVEAAEAGAIQRLGFFQRPAMLVEAAEAGRTQRPATMVEAGRTQRPQTHELLVEAGRTQRPVCVSAAFQDWICCAVCSGPLVPRVLA